MEEEKRELSFSNFLEGLPKFYKFIEHERVILCVILCVSVFMTVLEVIAPYTLKLVFDRLPKMLVGGELGFSIFFLVLSYFGLLVLESSVYNLYFQPLFIRVVTDLEKNLILKVQRRLLNLSMSYHERENTSKKVDKVISGCGKVVEILSDFFWGFFPRILLLVLNIVVVFYINWRLGLLFIVPFFLGGYVYLVISKKYRPIWDNYQELREESAGRLGESVMNIATVQSYVREGFEEEELSKIREEMRGVDFRVSLEMQRYFYYVRMVFNVFIGLLILLGVYFAVKKLGTLGDIVFVILASHTILDSIHYLVDTFLKITKKLVAVERLESLMNERVDIPREEGAVIPGEFLGELLCEDISFRYECKEEKILDGFSFLFTPGKMYGVVGYSGEGKSTLIKLMQRSYDVSGGSILLDGLDIRRINRDWYRSLFAVVPQTVSIFNNTIEYNVRYSGVEVSSGQVEEALRAANLGCVLDDVAKFPKGVQEMLGERGVNLSGGEAQRVGIARAYLALKFGGRKFLILDESTSNLDSMAEKEIQEIIQKLRVRLDITIISIAHRLSTIMDADSICVINQGGLEGCGTHEELMISSQIYQEMAKKQKIG